MAFYGDELSPLRNSANMNERSRLGWKPMLVKKDTTKGFAPIVEEKEEDMSSEGSVAIKNKHSNTISSMENETPVVNKTITFSKPRKYVIRRKEPPPTEGPDNSLPRRSTTTLKTTEGYPLQQEVRANFTLGDYKDTPWNRAAKAAEGVLSGWPKSDKLTSQSENETVVQEKPKVDRKKVASVVQNIIQRAKQAAEWKVGEKKQIFAPANKKKETPPSQSNEQSENENMGGKTKGKGKKKKVKGEMNMRDVVNVYKNLTYGTKEEVKTFLEKLPLTKKSPRNKEKRPARNLKLLEGKLKELEKKVNAVEIKEALTRGESRSTITSKGRKDSKHSLRSNKTTKKTQKTAAERLSRNKVVKVPATLDYTYSPIDKTVTYGSGRTSGQLTDKEVVLARRKKIAEERQPWKYVGRQSLLDQKYLVYPAYMPSKIKKPLKKRTKKTPEAGSEKKSVDGSEVSAKKLKKTTEEEKTVGKKVKASGEPFFLNKTHEKGVLPRYLNDILRNKSRYALSLSRSMPQLDPNGFIASRDSATSVCNVEFRPTIDSIGNTMLYGDSDPSEPSILFYLHNMKAINVRSPFKNKQFSRVKFFRKSGLNSATPLIKGQVKNPKLRDNLRKLSVRNITLPDELSLQQIENDFFERFNFDEDIENINQFLHSQRQQLMAPEMKRQKKQEKNKVKKEQNSRTENTTNNISCNCQHHHQHGKIEEISHHEKISPDLIINEIEQDISELSQLPDTKENRQIIAQFFEKLDQQIEKTRAESIVEDAAAHYSKLIPVVTF